MSRRSSPAGMCWELVGQRAQPRRRWAGWCLWLGSLLVCLGYVLKLVWFAVGGSIQIHLVYDQNTESLRELQAPPTNPPSQRLEDQIDSLEQDLQRELAQVRQALEQVVPKLAERDELELHFRTLSTRELLEWLPVWLTDHGYAIPREVQLRLTISRQRLTQLEQALSELGRQS